MMEHNKCPACAQAEKLGLNEQQENLFHILVASELAVASAMSALQESGVDMEDGVEEALGAAVDAIMGEHEERTLN